VLFAHDTEMALTAAAALVNTAADGPDGSDTLSHVAQLEEFVREQGWSGAHARTRAELDAVRTLRPRLRAVWQGVADGDVDGVVELVNAMLREAGALPQLVRHDGWDYHLHATAPTAPLADRMAVEAAMAFVDVVRGGETDRLRICAGADCDDVLVDLSKNRSRRYCDAGCGNRAHVAAYRARRAAVRT
jgi:predicted RNA-binding Zn ribbon-like protein